MNVELQPAQILQGVRHTYLIESRLGQGGFGITWKATDEDNQTVVIKQLRLDKISDWKTLDLFHREAVVLENLNHAQIPAYVEFFASDGQTATVVEPGVDVHGMLFLVQKFVPGKNLNQHMEMGTKFTPSEIREILTQSLKILKYIHELSPPVVHRDLHPRNLIWDDSGKVYLIDFGAMQDRLRFEGEMGSTSVGTFGFIPLEQSMGRAQPSSDLYALGMTMMALVSGRAPHELPVNEQTGKVQVESVVQDQDLRRVINEMVEPIAGNRVKSAQEALEILISRNAVVRSKPSHLVQRDPVASLTAQRIYTILVVSSAASAAMIYLGMFNVLSETQLVQIAPFWFVPLALGVSGKITKYSDRPYRSALIGAGAAVLALFVFLFGIFPSM